MPALLADHDDQFAFVIELIAVILATDDRFVMGGKRITKAGKDAGPFRPAVFLDLVIGIIISPNTENLGRIVDRHANFNVA